MSTKTWGEILNEAEESGGFKLLPKAIYVVRVHKAKVKEASTKKKGVGVTWQVKVGPEKGNYVHKDFWPDPDDPGQMGAFIKAMKIMGFEPAGQPSDYEEGLEHIADQIMGGVCIIKVGHKDWNDETRHDVAPWDIKPYEGPPFEESTTETPDASTDESAEPSGDGPPAVPF